MRNACHLGAPPPQVDLQQQQMNVLPQQVNNLPQYQPQDHQQQINNLPQNQAQHPQEQVNMLPQQVHLLSQQQMQQLPPPMATSAGPNIPQMQGGEVIVGVEFYDHSVGMKCPNCHSQITTTVREEMGIAGWIFCVAMFLAG